MKDGFLFLLCIYFINISKYILVIYMWCKIVFLIFFLICNLFLLLIAMGILVLHAVMYYEEIKYSITTSNWENYWFWSPQTLCSILLCNKSSYYILHSFSLKTPSDLSFNFKMIIIWITECLCNCIFFYMRWSLKWLLWKSHFLLLQVLPASRRTGNYFALAMYLVAQDYMCVNVHHVIPKVSLLD